MKLKEDSKIVGVAITSKEEENDENSSVEENDNIVTDLENNSSEE